MASNSDLISIAKISQYLWRVQAMKDEAFRGGSIDNNHAQVLYMERKAFEWGVNQSISTVSQLNPYIYSLCGAKLQQANQIFANGSSGVVPSPTGTGYYTPYAIDHTVTVGESGVTTISNSEWVNLIGLVELFINQQVFQLNVGFTYVPGSGTLDFDQSAGSGNVYTLQTGDVITSGGLTKIVTN